MNSEEKYLEKFLSKYNISYQEYHFNFENNDDISELYNVYQRNKNYLNKMIEFEIYNLNLKYIKNKINSIEKFNQFKFQNHFKKLRIEKINRVPVKFLFENTENTHFNRTFRINSNIYFGTYFDGILKYQSRKIIDEKLDHIIKNIKFI